MTPVILNIETGGDNCSVALSKGKDIIAIKENCDREHSKYLSVFIDEIVKANLLSYNDIDAVAISKGPGSYTGLRIGVATAKGICYALNKPLIAIDSLLSLANICKQSQNIEPEAMFLPLIDARRLEVYTALFNASLSQLTNTEAIILSENSFQEILEMHKVYFFGSGSEKCKELIKHPNAIFTQVKSSARGLVAPAHEAYNKSQFEDIAYFEPLYLKDFVATKSKKTL